jgi:hypothetical protein
MLSPGKTEGLYRFSVSLQLLSSFLNCSVSRDKIAYLLFWGILLWTSPNVVSIPARGIIEC